MLCCKATRDVDDGQPPINAPPANAPAHDASTDIEADTSRDRMWSDAALGDGTATSYRNALTRVKDLETLRAEPSRPNHRWSRAGVDVKKKTVELLVATLHSRVKEALKQDDMEPKCVRDLLSEAMCNAFQDL